jgi:hypothetical protein
LGCYNRESRFNKKESAKMVKSKRGWHNPPKWVEPTTKGKCPYCKKRVESLEKHIHDEHIHEKGVREKIKQLMFAREKQKEG